jgi:hypothetical protein
MGVLKMLENLSSETLSKVYQKLWEIYWSLDVEEVKFGALEEVYKKVCEEIEKCNDEIERRQEIDLKLSEEYDWTELDEEEELEPIPDEDALWLEEEDDYEDLLEIPDEETFYWSDEEEE